jgi:hypothetical protein
MRKGGVAQMVQLAVLAEDTQEEAIPEPLQQLIADHEHLFQEPTSLPPQRPFDHAIPTIPGVQPVNIKPYRYNPSQKDKIERQVKEMLLHGVIQPSCSPFASPVISAKKKDNSWCFCVDYRHLNNIPVKNKYPLPVVDELLDELHGANWFTKLNMRSGYHQIRLRPEDEHKTAFKTHNGHWQFKVMPFGLTNAPATFQAAMNTIFAPLLQKCVLIFMDDILIYSSTLDKHVQHIQAVFQLLKDNNLFLKRSKCSFAQAKIDYLTHVISGQGVATDPLKVQAVQTWDVPASAKDHRAFLGLAGYYRKFIKHYGLISKSLTDLLKKNTHFSWTPQHQQCFDQLKQALLTAPVLALPDFTQEFTVETDASDKGIGVVLMQKGHPIAYLSKALSKKAQTLSTYEKECLAIILAVDKWKAYLQHQMFTIATDQRSLIHLGEQKLLDGMYHKAFVKLLGLHYKIAYKKGLENKAADALSRKSSHTEIHALCVSTSRWLEIIVEGYQQDDHSKQLLSELALSGTNDKGFTLSNGVIRYKGRIWLGNHKEAHQAVFLALHDNRLGGHSGIASTYNRIKALFA